MPLEPTRRRFLRESAALAVAVTVLGACDGGDGGATATTAPSGGPGPFTAGDLDLTAAHLAIEDALIDAYGTVLVAREAELVSSGLHAELTAFQEHHLDHARRLDDLLSSAGAPAVRAGELFPEATIPAAAELGLLTVVQVLGVLRFLEDAAAQTYASAVPRLSTPTLRQLVMTIGAAEARHAALHDVRKAGSAAGYDATAIIDGNYPVDASYLAG
jgi:hypothetical protein